MTRPRRRKVAPSPHVCPHSDCASHGWVGWGNLRAHGHRRGGPGRHDVHVGQVQRDGLCALRSAVKNGAVSPAEAIERLGRVPSWVWGALERESERLLVSAVGARTLAMAPRVGHHVAPGLAPACPPGFFTDGFRDYLTALLRHYGQWGQPVRWQATAPAPKPRW